MKEKNTSAATTYRDWKHEKSYGKKEEEEGLTKISSDYFYWLKYDFDNLFESYDGADGFLVFRPWHGGFNNIRMSLELAAVLAYMKNRILVLPPSYDMYLLKGDNYLGDFFDLDDIGLVTKKFEAFCDGEKIHSSWDAVEQKFDAIEAGLIQDKRPTTGNITLNFEKISPPNSFTKWKKVFHWEDIVDDSKRVIFFDKCLLGNFYQVFHSSRMQQVKKFVARHIHYRADVMELALEMIHQLGDQNYYAAHIRRNDFQYDHVRIPCEDIVRHFEGRVPSGSTLYIATDHTEKAFFKPLEDKYAVYYYDDLIVDTKIDDDLVPILEQLICTRAKLFIGQDYSTLSSYIYRLRGYMDDIENTDYHVNTTEYKISDQFPLRQTLQFEGNWHREHRDAWDFSEPPIFVSIASFMDNQLHKTIESALKHAANPNRLVFGINLQDSQQHYNDLQSKSYPNTRIILTPPDQSKGVVSARRAIIDELYENEDYFLQIDSHTRFKDNWDILLINQIQSIPQDKVVISTYPNEFTYPDPDLDYLKLPYNAPLVFNRFLNDNCADNRFKPRNLEALEDFDVVDNGRIAAGFLFTDSRWTKDVPLPEEGILFYGEEDYLTYLSYLRGWDTKVPSEAVVWHNYDWKDKNGKPYRLFNVALEKNMKDRSVEIINDVLFNQKHERSIEDLEKYLGVTLKKQ